MQIVTDRRALHRIPELDRALPKTMEYLKNSLEGLGCQVFSPMEGALCAFFDFGAKEAIAFRADADALPITERSKADYASTHLGQMHACGHDGHMAILLELARRLSKKEKLNFNILLVFQPAEETTGGAREICETGVFKDYRVEAIFKKYKVEAIFGLHLWPGLEAGYVFSRKNEMMARSCEVTVDIYGTDPAEAGHEYALYAVYGGGNRSHYTGVPQVAVHGCDNRIEYVYGGGNASDVRGTNVTIWGGYIGNAFGGGNGYSEDGNHDNPSALHYNPGANITADGTNLTIHGGTVKAAFGGSNQWGTIDASINVSVRDSVEPGTNICTGTAFANCPIDITELYGGGNKAPVKKDDGNYIASSDININITSCDAKIASLFGGAKEADYEGDISLTITQGQFQNVFGGNNLGGDIVGNVSLTLKGGTMVNAFGGKMPNAIGVPEEQLRKAAALSVCKINIDSDLRLAMTGTIRKFYAEHPDKFDPREYLKPARANIKELVRHKLVNVLGCAGKA